MLSKQLKIIVYLDIWLKGSFYIFTRSTRKFIINIIRCFTVRRLFSQCFLKHWNKPRACDFLPLALEDFENIEKCLGKHWEIPSETLRKNNEKTLKNTAIYFTYPWVS